ncbi:hypothetical protein E2C01_072343 [Portunus trituberculatus]|uniref:Uncharacterized protein n=1 Tax=Portunus trituberculatus TaxID=210409 RepID=A0A5B7IAY1_PORTR|nr:hypothetical protein [Portunus trituberculatus]
MSLNFIPQVASIPPLLSVGVVAKSMCLYRYADGGITPSDRRQEHCSPPFHYLKCLAALPPTV